MKQLVVVVTILSLAIWFASCVKEEPVSTDQNSSTHDRLLQSKANPLHPTIPPATVPLVRKDEKKHRAHELASDPITLVPSSVTATLGTGQSLTEHKVLHLPPDATPAMGDILFSFDLTGSMGDELNNVKVNATNIMTAVGGVIADSRFGVMSHMDYNGSFSDCGYSDSYGGGPDYPYMLGQAITANTGDVTTAINNLVMGWGNDGPENYTRPLYETYADPTVGFRGGSKRIVIAFLDNIPHDCQVDAILGGTWTTGPDPGRDAVAGTGDDLQLLPTLDAMDASNITLLPVYSGISTYEFSLWNAFAARTGGRAFQINSDGTIPGGIDIAAFIADSLVRGSTRHYSSITLQTCDLEYSNWLTSVVPASYTDITLGSPLDLAFDIVLTVPAGTPPGEHCFDVCAVGDGVELARQHVCITVTADMIDIPFDFRPGTCPNWFDMGWTMPIKLSIEGFTSFDVNQIDQATIRVEGLTPTQFIIRDYGTPAVPFIGKTDCLECDRLGPDGMLDLLFVLNAHDLALALGTVTNLECRVIHVTGNLKAEFGGTAIRGEDVLKIRTPAPPPSVKPRVKS